MFFFKLYLKERNVIFSLLNCPNKQTFRHTKYGPFIAETKHDLVLDLVPLFVFAIKVQRQSTVFIRLAFLPLYFWLTALFGINRYIQYQNVITLMCTNILSKQEKRFQIFKHNVSLNTREFSHKLHKSYNKSIESSKM